jgi:hypothetical protein
MSEENTETDRGTKGNLLEAYLGHYTILKFSGTTDSEPTGNTYLLAVVGAIVALVTFALLFVTELIESVLDYCAPLECLLALGIPIVLYKFTTIGAMSRVADRAFPSQRTGNGLGVAGVFAIVASVLFLYGIYQMLGAVFIVLLAPIVEICAVHALITAAVFRMDRSESDGISADMTDLIKSFVISLVTAIVVVSITGLIYGFLDVKIIILCVAAVAIATAVGFILIKVMNSKAEHLDNELVFSILEFSKPLVVIIILAVCAVIL